MYVRLNELGSIHHKKQDTVYFCLYNLMGYCISVFIIQWDTKYYVRLDKLGSRHHKKQDTVYFCLYNLIGYY